MISSLYRFHGYGSLRYVYSNGKTVRSRNATIRWVKNGRRKHPRISVVVGKKIFKSAVKRNRIRRRVYEYVRVNLPRLNDVYDIVIIITTQEFYAAKPEEITQQLDKLFTEATLYKTD